MAHSFIAEIGPVGWIVRPKVPNTEVQRQLRLPRLLIEARPIVGVVLYSIVVLDDCTKPP